MSYIGDFSLGSTFDFKFTTVNTSGVPTQLADSPIISAYPDNSITQLTAGITLTVDFDSVTGLNNVRVVATSGNGYAAGSNYSLVITTGTVGGNPVVGYVVGQFSIEARSALRPTTAGRTLDISAGGEAGLDWANIGSPTTTQGLSGTTVKTATDVETDTANIQSRLPAALSGDGFMKSDLKSIEDELTSGNNATLNLKKLSIINTLGVTIDIQNGSGDAIVVTASTGDALNIQGNRAAYLESYGDNGITVISAAFGSGVFVRGATKGVELYGDTSDGIYAESTVGGKSINAPQNIAVSDGDLTLAALADAVWDEILSGHLGAGSTGEKLNAAGAAGDPWSTALPGAYGAGTAGKIVGDNLDAAVSSRATQTSVDAIDDFVDTEVAAIKAKTDQLTFTVANQVDSNLQSVNDTALTGDGSGTPWGPA